jgi:hypothetical protein
MQRIRSTLILVLCLSFPVLAQASSTIFIDSVIMKNVNGETATQFTTNGSNKDFASVTFNLTNNGCSIGSTANVNVAVRDGATNQQSLPPMPAPNFSKSIHLTGPPPLPISFANNAADLPGFSSLPPATYSFDASVTCNGVVQQNVQTFFSLKSAPSQSNIPETHWTTVALTGIGALAGIAFMTKASAAKK